MGSFKSKAEKILYNVAGVIMLLTGIVLGLTGASKDGDKSLVWSGIFCALIGIGLLTGMYTRKKSDSVINQTNVPTNNAEQELPPPPPPAS